MEETSHIVDRKRMRSQTLDLLRFPLAVVVLLIHTFGVEGLGVNGRAFEPEQYPLFVVVRDAIEAFLGGQSVPVYFFISGYVFFLGVETGSDEQVLENFSALGLQALILALSGIAGSVVFAAVLYRILFRNRKERSRS